MKKELLTETSKNRRFCAVGYHVWATGDTVDDLKRTLGYEDFADSIVYMIDPPCPAWVSGMGSVCTSKPIGNDDHSKVFPVLDLRKRATKKRSTSTKNLYDSYTDLLDSGSSEVIVSD